jgi:hypothetical protein
MQRDQIKEKLHLTIINNQPISVVRGNIAEESLYILPLEIGSQLVLGECISDFRYDGFKIFNLEDVTDVLDNPDVEFRNAIMRIEKIERQSQKSISPNLDGWENLFKDIKLSGVVVAVECESVEYEEEYYIGKVLDVNEDSIQMQTFNTVAEWISEAETILYKDITSVSFENRYITVYSKYLP